jgi:hypothetical protein
MMIEALLTIGDGNADHVVADGTLVYELAAWLDSLGLKLTVTVKPS